MGGGASKVQAAPASNRKLVVIIADYDGCFDSLFRFAPAVSGQTVDEKIKDTSDPARYMFLGNKPDDQEYISALQDWLVQQTNNAETMFYCG